MKRLHRDSKYFAAITPPALDIFPWDVFISGRSAGFEASLSTDSKGNDERSDGIQEGIFRYYPLLWYFAVVAAVATKGLVRYIRYGVTWTTSGRMDHFPKSIPQVWMMKHRVGSWTGRCHTANRVGRGGEGRETGKLDYDSSGSVVGNWLFSYLNYVGTGKCYWGQGVGD